MRDDVAFVHAPELAAWLLAPDHPFRPDRVAVLEDLLRAVGLLRDAHVVPPAPLPDGALAAVHDPRYLDVVARASRGDAVDDLHRWGLGTPDTPVFAGMHEAVAGVCAATTHAVDRVLDGRAARAAAFAGGLHHAFADRASGFCIYNDLAVAIRHARDRGARVAYLDVDAHHGDGVQAAFYDDPHVLTFSVHESGHHLFPGTGHGYELGRGAGRGWSLNLPLEPFSDDAAVLEAFDLVAPEALRAFRPDLIVLQAGADAHARDPLADLSLTLRGYRALVARVVELADAYAGGRIVVTGGGGYAAFDVVPRAWGHAWATLVDATLPDALPEAWRARWADVAGGPLPASAWDDEADGGVPAARRRAAADHDRAVARRLLRIARPLWEAASDPAAGKETT